MINSDMDCLDMMTSSTSTLPYDDDKMQKMITLVEKAKGKVIVQEWDGGHRLVVQMRRVVCVKSTMLPGLVSVYYILTFSTYILYPARLLSFFGKPGLKVVTGAQLVQLVHMFSTLEVPTLPWTGARTTYEGPDRI